MESRLNFLSSSKRYGELQQKLENVNEIVKASLTIFMTELDSDCPYSIVEIIDNNFEGESYLEVDNSDDTYDIDWWNMHGLLSTYIGKLLDKLIESKSKSIEVDNWIVYETKIKGGLIFHSFEHKLPGFTEEAKPISMRYEDLVSILDLSQDTYGFVDFIEEMLDQVLLDNIKSHLENPDCYKVIDSDYIVDSLCQVLSEDC